MLQLHDIIENFPKDEKLQFLLGLIKDYKEENQEACFDFGDVRKFGEDLLQNLTFYSDELFQNEMFRLPYNPVYYSWSRDHEKYGVFVIQDEDKPNEIQVLYILAEKNPFFIGGVGTVIYKYEARTDNLKHRTGYVNIDGSMAYTDPRVQFVDEESIEILYKLEALWPVVFTALMQSTHTKTRRVEFSDRLNRKREKRGLHPIMPYHTVYFEVGGKNYNTDGTEVGGGAHASPRMHWRRGHVRKLESGKMTHVRPCLVNAMGSDVSVPKPKYELRVRENT
jgi:hypothetical protein